MTMLAWDYTASATIIIDDTFTAPNDTALVGRMPAPTNVPAAIYAGNGNVSIVGGFTGGTPYEADVQNNAVRLGSDAGLGLNLGISTPQQFLLSIDFNISGSTQTQANNAHRGAALGFFSSMTIASGGSSHCFNNFTGLTVDRTGSVRLIIGGADSGIFTTLAGFDPATTHTFSFVVDTAGGVGSISNISLDGTSVSLTAPVNTFSLARTTYAGFYNSSGNIPDLATFDNFFVAIIPEPANLIGVIGIILVACLWEIRNRRLSRDTGKR
ncbi:MAG: hypothetical protein ABI925_04325 [Verrucomicrobiota bacterium]